MQQQIKKRVRRKKEYLLLTDFECLTQEELIMTITDMRIKLKKVFRKHIGKENFITPVTLFEEVYGINPSMLDIFKKNYWWNVIKNVLRQLRRDEVLFVINKGTALFVLSSQEEADMFKHKVDCDINNMKLLKIKADNWIREKKWMNL